MADFAARIPAVPTKGELAGAQIMHAQMEQGVILFFMMAFLDLSVDAQIHVTIDGGVVMADGDALGSREEVCEVARRRRDGIYGRKGLVVVVRDLIFWHMVEVVVVIIKVFIGGGGIGIKRGTGGDRKDVPWGVVARYKVILIPGLVTGVEGLRDARMCRSRAVFSGRGIVGAVPIASARGIGAVASAGGGSAIARLILSPMYVSRHD